jgi:hypothetical protein
MHLLAGNSPPMGQRVGMILGQTVTQWLILSLGGDARGLFRRFGIHVSFSFYEGHLHIESLRLLRWERGFFLLGVYLRRTIRSECHGGLTPP